jgi:hypothetical protein
MITGAKNPDRVLEKMREARFFLVQIASYEKMRSWIRWTGRAFLGSIVVNHTRLAASNASINVREPLSNCGSSW